MQCKEGERPVGHVNTMCNEHKTFRKIKQQQQPKIITIIMRGLNMVNSRWQASCVRFNTIIVISLSQKSNLSNGSVCFLILISLMTCDKP